MSHTEEDELNSFFAKKDKAPKTKKITTTKPVALNTSSSSLNTSSSSVSNTASTTTTTTNTESNSPATDSPQSTSPVLSAAAVIASKQKTVVDLSQIAKPKEPVTQAVSESKETKVEVAHVPANMRWAEKSDSSSNQQSGPTKSNKAYPSLSAAKDEKKKPEIDHHQYVNQDKEQDPQEDVADSASKKTKKQQKPKKKTKSELEAEALMKELGLEEESSSSRAAGKKK